MNTGIPRYELQPGYSISRVLLGGWQLAGGHGSVDRKQAVKVIRDFVLAGVTTFDCADIYTGVEELFGVFIKEYQKEFGPGDLPFPQIHTKYVPDLERLSVLRKSDTEAVIDRSLKRLGVDRLDLVQFHWWDFSIPRYVETAYFLSGLQKAGKIRYIGVTNFDAEHLREILEEGIPVVSNQVQYSVLDLRPETKLLRLSQQFDFSLLCYGTVAGGFLSDRYLGEKESLKPLENRSLVKYRLIIDEFGGYDLFQELLRCLKNIASKHNTGITEIAAEYVLQKPGVAGVIIGVRNSRHLEGIRKLGVFVLGEDDLQAIDNIAAEAKGPKGPVYGLERDREGKHGRIMKYNLNKK